MVDFDSLNFIRKQDHLVNGLETLEPLVALSLHSCATASGPQVSKSRRSLSLGI